MSKEEFGKVVGERFADQVFINSESVRTGWFDIIQAHLANFKYISSLIDFEYFSLIASNELFIRKGLYDKIKFFDCGLGGVKFYGADSTKRGAKLANKDKALLSILEDLGGDTIYWSQIEGTYYKKSIFQQMVKIIEKRFYYEEIDELYEREEIYFPTVLRNLSKTQPINISEGGVYTFVPWGRATLTTHLSEVKSFLAEPSCCYYSVKRVGRTLNDFVRMYIRQHCSYYRELTHYVKGVEHMDEVKLFNAEKQYQFRQTLLRKWKVFSYYFTHSSEMIKIFKEKFGK